MLIVFLVSFLGFLIANRLITRFSERWRLSLKSHVGATFGVVIFFCMMMILLNRNPLLLWITIFLTLLMLFFLPSVLQVFLERRIKKDMLIFLDELILNMQAGQGFRPAFLSALIHQKTHLKSQMMELYNSILFPNNRLKLKSPFLEDLRQDFVEIDSSQAKTIDHAKNLRRKFRIIEKFRRRSGQASQQSRAQSLILTIMQIGLTLFMSHLFGFKENLQIIVASYLLFIIGLVLILSSGKKSKWKT